MGHFFLIIKTIAIRFGKTEMNLSLWNCIQTFRLHSAYTFTVGWKEKRFVPERKSGLATDWYGMYRQKDFLGPGAGTKSFRLHQQIRKNQPDFPFFFSEIRHHWSPGSFSSFSLEYVFVLVCVCMFPKAGRGRIDWQGGREASRSD